MRLAQLKGIEYLCQIDSGLPDSVIADSQRVRQILINLLGNAIKFTDQGEVELYVGQIDQLATDDTTVLNFRVKDSGVGVHPEATSEIFESFSQADSTTTREFGGSGLGLAICKQLVELMGGDIGMESVVGSGSEFYFTVPVKIGEQKERRKPVSPGRLAGHKVLVVDDNATNRDILQAHLTHWGAAVDCVADEFSQNDLQAFGISHCLNKPVLEEDLYRHLCWAMDGRPGLAAQFTPRTTEEHDSLLSDRDIREARIVSKNGSPIPELALTANVSAEDQEKCVAAGMDDYLAKPYSFSDLQAVLQRLLAGTQTETPILDPVALEKFRNLQTGEGSILTRLVDVYLETCPSLVEGLANALEQEDANAVQAAAHSLKSSSAALGATDFSCTFSASAIVTGEVGTGSASGLPGANSIYAKSRVLWNYLCAFFSSTSAPDQAPGTNT